MMGYGGMGWGGMTMSLPGRSAGHRWHRAMPDQGAHHG